MDSTNEIRARARSLAAQWFKAQCQDPYAAFYLYVRPASATVFGDLLVAQDGPEGFEPAWPERISPAWTQDAVRRWIIERAQRLPILNT